jgi:type III secretion system (T3SS) SseB-like protein
MESLRIAARTKVLVGAPAAPMAQYISDAIGETISRVPGVIEAHLPQCFVPGVMEAPAQVLIIVVESRGSIAPALESLSGRLPKVLPEGMHLDVWPIESAHPSLAMVRGANCKVF